MPIYGYRCQQCGHEFEVMQSMSEPRLTVCPECGGELQKMLYPAGVHFKGSGFYTTDYRDSGSATSASSNDKNDAPSGKNDAPSGKSDGGSTPPPSGSTPSD